MRVLLSVMVLMITWVANSHMMVRAHWCGGRLDSITINCDDDHVCRCGTRPMKPGCCADHEAELEASSEYLGVETEKMPDVQVAVIVPDANGWQDDYALRTVPEMAHVWQPPPDGVAAPYYLLYRSILI